MSTSWLSRFMPELRSAAPFVLLGLATVLSGWMLVDLAPEQQQAQAAAVSGPDLIIESLVATTLDENGQPRRRVRAREMLHMPDTETHELSEPYMEVFSPGEEPWFVRSQRGWLSPEGDVMLLLGEVHIWRNGADGSRRLNIRTNNLRVLPDSEYGETDEPVSITTPHSRSTAVGVRAFLNEGRVEMLSRVRTVYQRDAFKN